MDPADLFPHVTEERRLGGIVEFDFAVAGQLALGMARGGDPGRCPDGSPVGPASTAFDVWFTHAYGSLTISRAQDIETTALLAAVALLVGQLGARGRRHRLLVEVTSCNPGRVHAVAEMVAAGSPADQVVTAVTSELRSARLTSRCEETDTLTGRFPTSACGTVVSASIWVRARR